MVFLGDKSCDNHGRATRRGASVCEAIEVDAVPDGDDFRGFHPLGDTPACPIIGDTCERIDPARGPGHCRDRASGTTEVGSVVSCMHYLPNTSQLRGGCSEQERAFAMTVYDVHTSETKQPCKLWNRPSSGDQSRNKPERCYRAAVGLDLVGKQAATAKRDHLRRERRAIGVTNEVDEKLFQAPEFESLDEMCDVNRPGCTHEVRFPRLAEPSRPRRLGNESLRRPESFDLIPPALHNDPAAPRVDLQSLLG